MSFDLEALALKTDTVFVPLRHPVTDEPLKDGAKAVGVHVYGTASEQYRAAVSAMQNRQLKRGNKKITAELAREEGVELLVAVSDKTENLTYKGKPVADAVAFRALYSDPQFSWLREQVDAAVGDTGTFLNQ